MSRRGTCRTSPRRRGRAPPRRRGHAAPGLDLPGRRVDRARPPGAAPGQRPAARAGGRRPRPSCSTAAPSPSRRSGTSASTTRRRSCSTGSTSTRGESSSLVRIAVEAPSKEEARRTAQEVAEVATVLFNDRFAPQTTASVWEAAARRRGARLAEAGPESRARRCCLGRSSGSRSCSSASSADERPLDVTRRRPAGARRRRTGCGRRQPAAPEPPLPTLRLPPPASGPSPTSSGSWPSRGMPSPSGARSWSCTSTRSAASQALTAASRATSSS